MLPSIVAILVAVSLTAIIVKRERGQGTQLRGGRTPLLKVGVQIICGDCSGDYEKPRRTYLDLLGRCEDCGGTSYVLASTLATGVSHFNQQSQVATAGLVPGGRILPFHSHASKKSTSPLSGEVAGTPCIS